MRNLEEYPIDANEVIESLDSVLNDLKNLRRVGGTQEMILAAVRRYLIDNPRATAAVVESLRA